MIKLFYIACITLITIIILLNNNLTINEHFNQMISTWTPYYVDIYNQPGYTNYFYRNGYMYPIY